MLSKFILITLLSQQASFPFSFWAKTGLSQEIFKAPNGSVSSFWFDVYELGLDYEFLPSNSVIISNFLNLGSPLSGDSFSNIMGFLVGLKFAYRPTLFVSPYIRPSLTLNLIDYGFIVYFRHCKFGLNLGIGVVFANHYPVEINYNYIFLNKKNHSWWNISIKGGIKW